MLELILTECKVTKSPAVASKADYTGCTRLSRSSKVDDFHVIFEPICYFLSVINSNLGPTSHRLATIECNSLQDHPRSMVSV